MKTRTSVANTAPGDADETQLLGVEMAPDTIKRAIGIKLVIIARQIRQRFDERLEQMGVTRAQWMLIAATARMPGATQRMIASQLEVTDVTAGRMIDRVCADGLLERRENPQDRRAYCVHVTEAAGPLLEKLAVSATAFESEVFVDVTDAELQKLDELLAKISTNLGTTRRDVGAGITAELDAAKAL